jgi:hypothetical protein
VTPSRITHADGNLDRSLDRLNRLRLFAPIPNVHVVVFGLGVYVGTMPKVTASRITHVLQVFDTVRSLVEVNNDRLRQRVSDHWPSKGCCIPLAVCAQTDSRQSTSGANNLISKTGICEELGQVGPASGSNPDDCQLIL